VPIPPAEGSAVVEEGTLMVDLNALARNIIVYLRPGPEPKECRRTFYALANILSQMTGDEPMPLECDFWTPACLSRSG
jgi:hypothetical protein